MIPDHSAKSMHACLVIFGKPQSEPFLLASSPTLDLPGLMLYPYTRHSTISLSVFAPLVPNLSSTCSDAEFDALKTKLWSFMHAEIYPNELLFQQQCHEIGAGNDWHHAPILVELMVKAKGKAQPFSQLAS